MSETDNIFEGVEEDIVAAIKTKAISGTRKTTVSGNFNVTGKTTLAELCVTGNAVYDTISANNVDISGNLTVLGKSTLANVCAGNVTVSNDLTVDGLSTLANACIGNLTVKDETNLCGDVLINCIRNEIVSSDWSTRIDGAGTETGLGIAADSNFVYGIGNFATATNVYNANGSVGESLTSTGGGGAYIAKWDTSGNTIWATKVDGPAIDSGSSIALQSGNVYGSGSYGSPSANIFNADGSIGTNLASPFLAAYLAKWDTTGSVIWATKIDGSSFVESSEITTDSDFVYNTGYFTTFANIYNADSSVGANLTATGQGVYIVKWDNSGDVVWATKVDGSSTDDGKGIFTESGNVYGTGGYTTSASVFNSNNTVGKTLTATGRGAYIAKWNSLGDVVWATKVDGSNFDQGESIYSHLNNVYAVGRFNTSATVYNQNDTSFKTLTSTSDGIYIAKWGSSGEAIWATKIDGPGLDFGTSIFVNSSGVYVCGNFTNSATIFNSDDTTFTTMSGSGTTGFLVKYNLDGDAIWTVIGGTTVYNVNINALENIYITGDYTSSKTTFNFVTKELNNELVTLTAPISTGAFVINLTEALKRFIQKNANVVLQICSDTTIDGDLTVKNNTDLCGNLTVKDNTDLCGNLTVKDNTDLCGNLTVKDNTDLCGNLTVKNKSTLNEVCAGELTILGNLTVDDTSDLNGNVNIGCIKTLFEWATRVDSTSIDSGRSISYDSESVYGIGNYRADANVYNANGSLFTTLPFTTGLISTYLTKWDSNGNAVWATKVVGSTSSCTGSGVYANSDVYGTGNYTTSANIFNSDGTIGKFLSTSSIRAAYIAKWDTTGNVVWATQVDGILSSVGEGRDIYVDSNFVYGTGAVTGTTANIYNADGSLFTTLTGVSGISYIAKWDTTGNVSWATKVEGPGSDSGRGIFVESEYVYGTGDFNTSANVYNSDNTIGATLTSSSTGAYIAKWNSTGDVIWATKIDGSGSDIGYKIYADSENVYGVGKYNLTANVFNSDGSVGSVLTSTGEGAYVTKWDSSGFVSWTTKIDGSGTYDGFNIFVNKSGIYSTGQYTTTATIYNKNNIPFTTINGTSNSIYIVKWSFTGDVIWVINITSSGVDVGYGITVNNLGEIYATGQYSGVAEIELTTSINTMKLGTLVLPELSGAYIFKLTDIDNLLQICSNTTIDASLTVTKNTTLNEACITDLIVKNDSELCGNVFINCEDVLLPKLNWSVKIDGSNDDNGRKIVSDTNFVYNTGIYTTSTTVYNANGSTFTTLSGAGATSVYVAKWDKFGTTKWATKIDGSSTDNGYGISVNSDNIYCSGYFFTSTDVYNSDNTIGATLTALHSGVSDYFVKWNPGGTVQWALKVDDEIGAALSTVKTATSSDSLYGSSSFLGNAFVYSANGDLSSNVLGEVTSESVYVAKWDLNGSLQWTTKILCDGSINTEGINTDESESVYITGEYVDDADIYNASGTIGETITTVFAAAFRAAYVAKWNSSGTVQWATKIDSNVMNADIRGKEIYYYSGNVYGTGTYTPQANIFSSDNSLSATLTGSGSYVVKWSSSGIFDWASKIDGLSTNEGIDVTVNENGVYGTGYITNSAGVYNSDNILFANIFATGSGSYIVKWDLNGDAKWIIIINSSGSEEGYSITINNDDIYASGYYTNTPDIVLYTDKITTNIGSLSSVTSEGAYIIKLTEVEQLLQFSKKNNNAIFQICSNTTIDADLKVNNNLTVTGNTVLENSLHVEDYIDGSFGQLIPFNNFQGQFPAVEGNPVKIVSNTFTTPDSTEVRHLVPQGFWEWAASVRTGPNNAENDHIAMGSCGIVYQIGQGQYPNGQIRGYNRDNTIAWSYSSGYFGPGVESYITKMHPTGFWEWNAMVAHTGADQTSGIAIDRDNTVYVVGKFTKGFPSGDSPMFRSGGPGAPATISIRGLSGTFQTFVGKCLSNGNWQWGTRIQGVPPADPLIQMCPDQNPLIYGLFDATLSFVNIPATTANSPVAFTITGDGNNDIYLAKISPTGYWQWRASIRGTSTDLNIERDGGVAIDKLGNIYVTGTYQPSTITFYENNVATSLTLSRSGDEDAFVAKLNVDGKWEWVLRVYCPAGGSVEDVLRPRVKINPLGGVYFIADADRDSPNNPTFENADGTIGATANLATSNGRSVIIGRLDATGYWRWASYIRSSGDVGTNLVTANFDVDSAGIVYTLNRYSGTADYLQFGSNHFGVQNTLPFAVGVDLYIGKLLPTGSWEWATKIGDSGTQQSQVDEAILVDQCDDSVYISGYSDTTSTIEFFSRWTGNVAVPPTAGSSGGTVVINYPNPTGSTVNFLAKIGGDADWKWVTMVGSGAATTTKYEIKQSEYGDIYLSGTYDVTTANFFNKNKTSTNGPSLPGSTTHSNVFLAKIPNDIQTGSFGVLKEISGSSAIVAFDGIVNIDNQTLEVEKDYYLETASDGNTITLSPEITTIISGNPYIPPSKCCNYRYVGTPLSSKKLVLDKSARKSLLPETVDSVESNPVNSILEYYFTSSTSVTIPNGANFMKVNLTGGGGGGGGGSNLTSGGSSGAGGGGGSSLLRSATFDVSNDNNSTITVTVGTGGTGGAVSTNGGGGGISCISFGTPAIVFGVDGGRGGFAGGATDNGGAGGGVTGIFKAGYGGGGGGGSTPGGGGVAEVFNGGAAIGTTGGGGGAGGFAAPTPRVGGTGGTGAASGGGGGGGGGPGGGNGGNVNSSGSAATGNNGAGGGGGGGGVLAGTGGAGDNGFVHIKFYLT